MSVPPADPLSTQILIPLFNTSALRAPISAKLSTSIKFRALLKTHEWISDGRRYLFTVRETCVNICVAIANINRIINLSRRESWKTEGKKREKNRRRREHNFLIMHGKLTRMGKVDFPTIQQKYHFFPFHNFFLFHDFICRVYTARSLLNHVYFEILSQKFESIG